MVERAAEPNFRFRMTLSESPQAGYREAAIGDDVMASMTALHAGRWNGVWCSRSATVEVVAANPREGHLNQADPCTA
jgi:hypothetical protein